MASRYPKNVCVFGAASDRVSDHIKKESYEVGVLIGKKGHNLIYGAGSSGVMGAVVYGYLSTNPPTKPLGSTTHFIQDVEHALPEGVIHQINCRTMKDRKDIYQLADVVLVMPGGNGTADELLEFMTYKQLNDMAPEGDPSPYWNGRILLWNGGVAKHLIKLWEAMNEQNMAPDWRKYVELVDTKDLEDIL